MSFRNLVHTSQNILAEATANDKRRHIISGANAGNIEAIYKAMGYHRREDDTPEKMLKRLPGSLQGESDATLNRGVKAVGSRPKKAPKNKSLASTRKPQPALYDEKEYSISSEIDDTVLDEARKMNGGEAQGLIYEALIRIVKNLHYTDYGNSNVHDWSQFMKLIKNIPPAERKTYMENVKTVNTIREDAEKKATVLRKQLISSLQQGKSAYKKANR